MQKTILSIIALALFGLASAQVKFEGACPNVPPQSNFELSKYMGTFYEYAKYPVDFEGNSKCVTVSHEQISETEMSVLDTMVDPSTNKKTVLTGSAQLISNGKFQSAYNIPNSLPQVYWIMSTDYVNYAIAYSCEPAGDNSHNKNVWIFTREQKPSAATIENAMNDLSSNGISLAPLTVTDQSNC